MPRWGSEPPFVGRVAEFGRLVEGLARARDGAPSGVLLSGDAGVGKTRLLTEAARLAQSEGMTVLVGHCMDLGDVGLPYLPFTEVLGRLVGDGQRRTELAERHPVLGPWLGAPSGHGAAAGVAAAASAASAASAVSPASAVDPAQPHQLQLFGAVATLLAELSAERPVLLVLEDLHWADQSTRDLLRFLLGRLDRQPLMVVGSYRSDDLHRRHPLRPLLAELARLPLVDRLALEPLPDAEVAVLVRSLQDHPLGDSEVRRIVDLAEGNAFYAEELLQATLNCDTASVPLALSDVLLAQLETLPNGAQRVVRIAAVAGRRVQHALLREATGLEEDELEVALREAVTRHVLEPREDETYAFRHALLREAAYADLLPGERVRIHSAFARLLAQGSGRAGSAAELAHHRRASHDLPGALTATLQAADEAQRLGAPAERLHQLHTALTLWAAVPDAAELTGRDEVSLMLTASNAAMQAGDLHRAVGLTRAALDRVESPADLELAARIRYTLAQNLIQLDLDQAAYVETTAAMELLPELPRSLTRTWAAATHARAAYYIGDRAGARRAAEEALAAAEELGADAAWADTSISLARMGEAAHDADAATALLVQAHERARRSGDIDIELRAIYNLAVVRYEQGDLPGALHWLDLGLHRASARGLKWSPYPTEMRYLQVVVRYVAGDWDGSVRAARPVGGSAPDSAAPAGGSAPDSAAHVAPAALFVAVGRGDADAPKRVAEALSADTQHPLVAMIVGSAAIELAGWTDPAGAPALLERTCTVVAASFGPDFLGSIRLIALTLSAVADLAVTARMLEDTGSTAAHLERARALSERAVQVHAADVERFGGPGVEATAWLARVEAEWSRAQDERDPLPWRRAVDAFDYGHVYEQARSRWRLAETLLAAGRRAEATEQARMAHEAALRLGAVPLREAVEALVRRGRLDAALPGPAAGRMGSPLTPREHEVLALLARGRTNRQIGRELYISEKTASVHVSNILAKLGAGGRAEAVSLAHRRGLIDQS